jgi:hypothetical protein
MRQKERWKDRSPLAREVKLDRDRPPAGPRADIGDWAGGGLLEVPSHRCVHAITQATSIELRSVGPPPPPRSCLCKAVTSASRGSLLSFVQGGSRHQLDTSKHMTGSGCPSRDKSERLAAPLEIGVACRPGANGASTCPRAKGWRSPVRGSLCGACAEVAGTGGGVRLRFPGCALLRGRRRISGKHAVVGDPRVVLGSQPRAANARCPSPTSRPARPAAANARGHASSAWATRSSRTELYSSSTPDRA